MFGKGSISSCSATGFKDYDNGTYFKVYPLRGKLINWPSENADVGRVDQLRGLRAAITGDSITFEQKYHQGIQEPCKAVFIFNVNEVPTLVITLKATETRWAVVPFLKTYSDHPDQGELKADPRFKEDPFFVREKILPAFLNRLLEQLQAVVNEGIDYTSTQHLLEEIQRESSHLRQFAHDTALHYDSKASISAGELWERLKAWYIDTGTLMVETIPTGKDGKTIKEKLLWVDQVKSSDKNVKGANQVVPRFLDLFPKAKKTTDSHSKKPIIKGLAFTTKEVCKETDPADPQSSGQEDSEEINTPASFKADPANAPADTDAGRVSCPSCIGNAEAIAGAMGEPVSLSNRQLELNCRGCGGSYDE